MKLHTALLLLTTATTTTTTTVQAFTAYRPSFVSGGIIITSSSSSNSSSSSSVNGRTLKSRNTELFGILDEVASDAFRLGDDGSDDSSPKGPTINDMYDQLLGSIVFSSNDPRVDIVENYDKCSDQQFRDWLKNKIEKSRDPEESLALKDLLNMVEDVVQKMELSKMAEERKAQEEAEAEASRLAEAEEAARAGKSLSNTDLLKKANVVNTAGVESVMEETRSTSSQNATKKKSFIESELTPEIRISYESLVKQLLPPYKPGESPASKVFNLYDQCDAQLVKVLTERANNGDEDSKIVLEALADEQRKRMEAATIKLKKVLSMGDPLKMEGAIIKLGKDGAIDEPLLLLLEVNANQAEAAGATGPAQLMRKLAKKANEEKDKASSSKEIRLLRKLLRTEDSEVRTAILTDAFTPRENILVEGTFENINKAAEGEIPEQEKPQPDVPPPDFINACKAVLLNFGNLSVDLDGEKGELNLSSRIKEIANEAEIVATSIYGKGMTTREQQDRAWAEQTTSIFDLERMELELESRGEHAPWANTESDDILPGFDADGKMKIGGS